MVGIYGIENIKIFEICSVEFFKDHFDLKI